MASIWGINNKYVAIAKTLLPRNQEIIASVIRTGTMSKTIRVIAKFWIYNHKYKRNYLHRHKYLVHDPDNYCRIGDIVVIKNCTKISKQKNFFVRNILYPIGRQNITPESISNEEKKNNIRKYTN